MFTVYEGMAELVKYRKFYLRDFKKDAQNDHYFMMLVGINLSGDVVEPVYKARVTILRRGGILGVQFPKSIVLFSRRYPWVMVQTTEQEKLEWK